MEQNENPFATAEAAWSPPSEASADPAPAAADRSPEAPGFDPVDVRARCDGWTPARQRAFIEELADCGIVREAAARVGMTEQSANRLRRRAGATSFGIAWDAAIAMGAHRLRSIAYERAITGTVKRHYYRGQVVGEDVVYDSRLLVYLLGKAKPPTSSIDTDEVVRDWDRWMQAVEDGLDRPMMGPDESDYRRPGKPRKVAGGPASRRLPASMGGRWAKMARTNIAANARSTRSPRSRPQGRRRRPSRAAAATSSFNPTEGHCDPPSAELSELSERNRAYGARLFDNVN